MKKTIHIDIETYSSADIKTSGAYKYTQSLDFEILLLAYAIDDEEVKIVDLAAGEPYPKEFLEALADPIVLKMAHNANFERQSFRAVGLEVPINQWECTAIKSAYCGLPLFLGGVSEALELGDKGKLASGAALIRFFCCPVKPQKSNGFKKRNSPADYPEKWQEFKEYCINDVVAEREIDRRLSVFTIPEKERELYFLDQKINDRGVLVDVEMAENVCEVDEYNRTKVVEELKELTRLENPNSPAQLTEWLSNALKRSISTVAKGEIEKLISDETVPDTVRRVLELRLSASKTSIKKFQTAINCAGRDSRIRGMAQFYGARTGRWAGRLVQLQNLKRNYIKDLALARNLSKRNGYQTLSLFYDDVSETLSQLIRTIFIPEPGKVLGIADFSAIEARVIAWLAGEQWRMDVFATHGKIYEASAAMMFGVDIKEVTRENGMRDKGKVAELALGYQGSLGALKQMGGESMGLSETEMKNIVVLWRKKSPNIVKLWDALNRAGLHCIETKKETRLKNFKDLVFRYENDSMTIELPSGRKLIYREAGLCENRFGQLSMRYKGVDATSKKWGWIETYGGKLAENIVQAIARDLLAESLLKLDREGFDIVMHVHDEAVTELDKGTAEQDLERMCEIMGEEVPWAEGLNLGAEGFISEFYKKD